MLAAYLLVVIATAATTAHASAALTCTTDPELSCIIAGKGITVTGKNITASGPLGEHVLGTLYVIDPAGGNGDILGCGGQGAWGFDYGGKDKDAYFNGKTQQVNGKLSGFFASNSAVKVTHDEVKSYSKGDDLWLYCA